MNTGHHAPPVAQRALRPRDLLNVEELGEAALSPDGRRLAYVLRRPRSTATFHKHDFLGGGDRSDVWVAGTDGGEPQNLTCGGEDGSGHWAPTWSPDGKRLALLSTRGGNVHAWVCDMDSKILRRLCARAADLHTHGTQTVWVSDDEILFATLPEGERPNAMTIEVRAAEIAMREWPKAWQGSEPTASVLDSGVPAPFEDRPQGALVLVNAATGTERIVMSGLFRDLRIAPDGRHVAFSRQVDVRRPDAPGKLPYLDSVRSELGIVRADGEVLTAGVPEIEQPLATTLRWSCDSAEVAVIGRADTPAGVSRTVFRYRLADGRVRRATDPSLEPGSIQWTGDGAILTSARSTDSSQGRPEWWLLADDHKPRRLPRDDDGGVPARLFPEEGRQTFVGLGAGDVLRLSVSDGRWSTLTDASQPRFGGVFWPRPGVSDQCTATQLLLTVDHGTCRDWFSLDLRSHELRSLQWPSAAGWLLDFSPEHATAVHVSSDRTGSALWVSRPAFERHRPVVETNAWLCDVAEGEIRPVAYRGLDGDELTGWLILPPGHEQGSRHPLITSIYPGYVYDRRAPPMTMLSIAGHHAHNPQLLAARGYAVLLPSMPQSSEGGVGDPCSDLNKGVMPAIDAAVELGVADPDRLGLMGHSMGGFGTYGLITQTTRFRAAVAMAGMSDLLSLYGQFDARCRYDSDAHEHLIQMTMSETGQLQMGGPPWHDAERYVRNSPLVCAQNVQTPVLIMQGDMDYVPLAQGEEFFTALYRQGKRARFVRYWGEGHVFQSPANIEDMWQRIYDWFGELLT